MTVANTLARSKDFAGIATCHYKVGDPARRAQIMSMPHLAVEPARVIVALNAGWLPMYDVVIVGAGPAGLAAGAAARRCGARVLLIEQGKPLEARSQRDRIDVISGIGGAGLFSDGKFSFFPSASALWSVRPYNLLAESYMWLRKILSDEGMNIPEFPSDPHINTLHEQTYLKGYPSFYLPIESRKKLLLSLAEPLKESLCTGQRVSRIEQSRDDTILLYADNGQVITTARRLIVAAGRLGALMLRNSLTQRELIFRRVELGIRIEQPSEQFILADDRYLDPKMIGTLREQCTWRTFCCCRNGLVVFGSSTGLSSVSGRADCPPTGRSNLGFMVRFTDSAAGMAAWRQVIKSQPMDEPVVEELSAVITRTGDLRPTSRVVDVLGLHTTRRLVDGLNDLAKFMSKPLTQVRVYAPAIEGVGFYPRISTDLVIPGRPIYFAGDITGIFRGLTAALLSGFTVGAAAAGAASRRTHKTQGVGFEQ